MTGQDAFMYAKRSCLKLQTFPVTSIVPSISIDINPVAFLILPSLFNKTSPHPDSFDGTKMYGNLSDFKIVKKISNSIPGLQCLVSLMLCRTHGSMLGHQGLIPIRTGPRSGTNI